MPDKQTILFPTNAQERSIYLSQSNNPAHRRLTRFRTFSGWALTITTLLFLATNFTLFSPTTIGQVLSYIELSLTAPDLNQMNSISYPSGSAIGTVQFNGGLALIDSDTLYIAQTGGLVQQTVQLSYAKPVLRTNGNRVLTFDRSGNKLSLSTAVSTPVQLTLDDAILEASLAESNDFAVVTKATGYRAAVSVYSDSGKQRFRWSTPDYYVQHAVLSPSGNRMCTLGFQQDGISLQSNLIFFDLDKDAAQIQVDLGSVVGVALYYIDEHTVLVVTDSGLLCADWDTGEAISLASYSADELLGFAHYDDYILLATRAWTGSARCTLSLYDRNKLIAQTTATEEPTGLSLGVREIAILTASGLSVYDYTLFPLWENPSVGGANSILLTDSGSVWALYAKNAVRVNKSDETSVECS